MARTDLESTVRKTFQVGNVAVELVRIQFL